jgi:hypothetical protein
MPSRTASLTPYIHQLLAGTDSSERLHTQIEQILASVIIVSIVSGLTQNTLLFAENGAMGGFITNQFTLFSLIPHTTWWLILLDGIGLLAAGSLLTKQRIAPRHLTQIGLGITFTVLLSKLLLVPGYLGLLGVVTCCGAGLLSLTPFLTEKNVVTVLRSFAAITLLSQALLLLTNPLWMEGLAVIGTRIPSPDVAQIIALLCLLSLVVLSKRFHKLIPLCIVLLCSYFFAVGANFTALGIGALLLVLSPVLSPTTWQNRRNPRHAAQA